jgi:thiol-disulfide isomerase/thioredoxin
MIYKVSILFLAIVSIATHLFSQSCEFTISGEVKNILTGKIYLNPGNIEKKFFIPGKLFDSAQITNGKFVFKRTQKDNKIYGYRLYIDGDSQSGSTDLVFIAPYNQYIFIDSISEYIAPIISSCKPQNEIRYQYNPFFSGFVRKFTDFYAYSDSIYEKYGRNTPLNLLDTLVLLSKKLTTTGDSLFLNYATQHANSFVTLWKLIERFTSQGYKMEYKHIYSLLANEIKNSTAGLLLKADLEAASLLSINNTFPIIKLKNIALNSSILNIKAMSNKFTLVDFWFSSCSPCLREFPRYKKLYETYKEDGFSIVGISTDDINDIEKWKKTILDLKLEWIQYLDENATFSKSVLISSFPTNFLLNAKGQIIAKNLSPQELENHLKVYLHLQNIYDKIQTNEPN